MAAAIMQGTKSQPAQLCLEGREGKARNNEQGASVQTVVSAWPNDPA